MKKQMAFTLIELMLVMAISAVLLAMSYPAYEQYETHAERNRAEVALFQLSALLEGYFNDNATYKGATIQSLHANILTKELQYQLKIMRADDAHYQIAAVPIAAQANRDYHCGALIINDLNQQTISGDGNAEVCWH